MQQNSQQQPRLISEICCFRGLTDHIGDCGHSLIILLQKLLLVGGRFLARQSPYTTLTNALHF